MQAADMTNELGGKGDFPPEIGTNNVKGRPRPDLPRADRFHRALIGVDRARVESFPGLSKTTLQRALRGEAVRRSTMIAFSQALGVNVDWLANGTGEMRSAVPAAAPVKPVAQIEAETVILDKLPRLTGEQRVAMRSCIILAHAVYAERPAPEHAAADIAETALDFFGIMCSANGTHSDRVLALERAVGAMMAAGKAPSSDP